MRPRRAAVSSAARPLPGPAARRGARPSDSADTRSSSSSSCSDSCTASGGARSRGAPVAGDHRAIPMPSRHSARAADVGPALLESDAQLDHAVPQWHVLVTGRPDAGASPLGPRRRFADRAAEQLAARARRLPPARGSFRHARGARPALRRRQRASGAPPPRAAGAAAEGAPRESASAAPSSIAAAISADGSSRRGGEMSRAFLRSVSRSASARWMDLRRHGERLVRAPAASSGCVKRTRAPCSSITPASNAASSAASSCSARESTGARGSPRAATTAERRPRRLRRTRTRVSARRWTRDERDSAAGDSSSASAPDGDATRASSIARKALPAAIVAIRRTTSRGRRWPGSRAMSRDSDPTSSGGMGIRWPATETGCAARARRSEWSRATAPAPLPVGAM